jgi:GTP-binding protein
MSDARFVRSAASVSDFPLPSIPEIALVGRSNVGKSSLINAIVGENLARTSAAPGKTRLINFYDVGLGTTRLYLVDLPGYGYARGGTRAAAEFERLTSQYFSAGRPIAGVLHLIDARHPELPHDVRAHEWLRTFDLPVAVVGTKGDQLKRAEMTRVQRTLTDTYGEPALVVSARANQGLSPLLQIVRRWM